MFLYETHMHTSQVSKCGTATPQEQVRAYKARGYTGVIVTDHFLNGHAHQPGKMSHQKLMEFFMSGYDMAKNEGDKIGLDVFFGWEYAVDGHDFLTYGLGLDFLIKHPEMLRTMPIDAYSKAVREAGGYLCQAHPFREAVWIENPGAVDASLLDGIEVYNASDQKHTNQKAYDFAKKHHLAMQSGSDSHSEHLDIVSGICLNEKAQSIHDIIHAIKSHQAGLIISDQDVALSDRLIPWET